MTNPAIKRLACWCSLLAFLFAMLLAALNLWAGLRLADPQEIRNKKITEEFIEGLLALTGIPQDRARISGHMLSDPLSRARFASIAYYQNQAVKLAGGAPFIQILPLSRMSRTSLRLILNNITSAFPNLRIFKVGPHLVLLASVTPLTLSPSTAASGHSAESILGREQWLPRSGFSDAYGRSFNSAALFYWGLRDAYYKSQTSADLILGTPDEWRWSLIYSRSSLLAEHIQSGATFDLQRVIQTACGSGKLDLIEPNWRFLRTPCRDALVAAIAIDPSTTPRHLQHEFIWLRDFIDLKTASAFPSSDQNLQEVLDHIYWFAQLDSIFMPLSPKRLIWQCSKCYTAPSPEHLFCRAELVRTLSYTGHLDFAEKELNSLRQDAGIRLDRKTITDLKSYLGAARSVR